MPLFAIIFLSAVVYVAAAIATGVLMSESEKKYSPRQQILYPTIVPLVGVYHVFRDIYLGVQFLYCGIVYNTWDVEKVRKVRRAKSLLKRKEAKEELESYMDRVLKEAKEFLGNEEEKKD